MRGLKWRNQKRLNERIKRLRVEGFTHHLVLGLVFFFFFFCLSCILLFIYLFAVFFVDKTIKMYTQIKKYLFQLLKKSTFLQVL